MRYLNTGGVLPLYIMNHGYCILFRSIAFITLVTFSSCFSVKCTSEFSYSKKDESEYASMLRDSSNYVLIDVRTSEEYEKGHIKNAVNFSFLDFHFKKDVKNIDRNTLVFVYCQTCHRSPLAARKMKHMGFRKVVDLKGGYRKWKS